jgi:hypothetical protein
LSPLPVEAVDEPDPIPVPSLETEAHMITDELKEELSAPPPPPVPPKAKAKPRKKAVVQTLPAAPEAHFLKQLATELGVQAQRLNIFSAPVDREHLTVIPVSQVFYGFTGESVRKNAPLDPWGAGALHASPLGYIEIKNGRSEFRKIPSRGVAAILPFLLKSGSFLLLALRRWYENYRSQEK